MGYGTQKLPGFSCADILATKCGKIEDGIYWIKLKGNFKSLLEDTYTIMHVDVIKMSSFMNVAVSS